MHSYSPELITTWIKIGDHFINQANIRGIARQGSGTRIQRITGNDLFVKVEYERVKELMPPLG